MCKLAFVIALLLATTAESIAAIEIAPSILSSGGGRASSSSFEMFSVLGQPVAGGASSASFSISTVLQDTISTPTLLALVSASAEPGRVRLIWYTGDRSIETATVYRRRASDNWEVAGSSSVDGSGKLAYEDTDVSAGERYGYRVGVYHGTEELFLGEVWVDVPTVAQLTLGGLRPNPATEDLTVAFSLRDHSPARLEMLDLAGRRVTSRDIGSLGSGTHVIRIPRGSLSPGMYMLRLTQGTHSITARAVIIR